MEIAFGHALKKEKNHIANKNKGTIYKKTLNNFKNESFWPPIRSDKSR